MTGVVTKPQDRRGKKRPGLEQQRRIIADAAVDQFIQRGSQAVSISEICTHADVSRHTFYRCYDHKDALVRFLYQTAVNDHIEAILQNLQIGQSGKQWMFEALDQTIDAILENHRIALFVFIESANPATPAYAIIDRAFDKAAEAIQQWAIASYGSKPLKETIKSIFVATQWLVQRTILAGMKPEDIDTCKDAARQVVYAAFLSFKPQ